MMEQIIQDYGSAYGIRYAILRYFNAAGADPEGQIGEDHDTRNPFDSPPSANGTGPA